MKHEGAKHPHTTANHMLYYFPTHRTDVVADADAITGVVHTIPEYLSDGNTRPPRTIDAFAELFSACAIGDEVRCHSSNREIANITAAARRVAASTGRVFVTEVPDRIFRIA